MIVPKSDRLVRRIEIDLTGPEGNPYVLLGYAKQFAVSWGLNWDELRNELTSGDYEHLISVFDEKFGKFVTLYR